MLPSTKQKIAIIKARLKLAKLEAKVEIDRLLAEDGFDKSGKFHQSARDARLQKEADAIARGVDIVNTPEELW